MEFYYHESDRDILVLSADGGLNADTASTFVEQLESLVDAGMSARGIGTIYLGNFIGGVLSGQAVLAGSFTDLLNVNLQVTDGDNTATQLKYKVTAVQVAPSNGPSDWQTEYNAQARQSRRIEGRLEAAE